jgi:hypothetical protein
LFGQVDEEILDLYVGGVKPTAEQLKLAIRKHVIARDFTPVRECIVSPFEIEFSITDDVILVIDWLVEDPSRFNACRCLLGQR